MLRTLVFFFFLFLILIFYCYSITVVYPFSPSLHPTPAEPPPSPTSTLPLDFVHESFIVVPVLPSFLHITTLIKYSFSSFPIEMEHKSPSSLSRSNIKMENGDFFTGDYPSNCLSPFTCRYCQCSSFSTLQSHEQTFF